MRAFVRWAAIVAIVATPGIGSAQVGIGAGGGWGLNGAASRGAHGMAFVELDLPVLPSIRGDVFLLTSAGDRGPAAVNLNLILQAPIPSLTPYVIGGWGAYGLGRDASAEGWNVGVGIRAAALRGLFVEARQHGPLDRAVLTIGIRK
jgi:hypothetical protein